MRPGGGGHSAGLEKSPTLSKDARQEGLGWGPAGNGPAGLGVGVGSAEGISAHLQGLPQQGWCQSWPTGHVRGFRQHSGGKGKPQKGSNEMCLSGRTFRWGPLFPWPLAGRSGFLGHQGWGPQGLAGRTHLAILWGLLRCVPRAAPLPSPPTCPLRPTAPVTQRPCNHPTLGHRRYSCSSSFFAITP